MNRTITITAAAAIAAVSASLFLLFVYGNATSSNSSNQKIESTSSQQPFPAKIIKPVAIKSPYIGHEAKPGEVVVIPNPSGFNGFTINDTYDGINQTQGIIRLNNQSYFMTTLDGNLKSIIFNKPNGTAVEFANVTFTFPSPAGIPLTTNPKFAVIVQYQNGTNETLYVQAPKDHPLTVLSSHNNPKAAITVTQANWLTLKEEDNNQGKVKLLVSTHN